MQINKISTKKCKILKNQIPDVGLLVTNILKLLIQKLEKWKKFLITLNISSLLNNKCQKLSYEIIDEKLKQAKLAINKDLANFQKRATQNKKIEKLIYDLSLFIG